MCIYIVYICMYISKCILCIRVHVYICGAYLCTGCIPVRVYNYIRMSLCV